MVLRKKLLFPIGNGAENRKLKGIPNQEDQTHAPHKQWEQQ